MAVKGVKQQRRTAVGLADGASYQEIATELGLSDEGVRRIEMRALAKLARRARAAGLAPPWGADAPVEVVRGVG